MNDVPASHVVSVRYEPISYAEHGRQILLVNAGFRRSNRMSNIT